VLGPDDHPVAEEFLLNLAKTDMAKFKDLQAQLIYVDQRGKRMTRKDFKDTIRVSAKNLNFGIPYGRGAKDIARQVKGETGTSTPLIELEKDIDQMMKTWKEEAYPTAWAYMQQCGSAVVDPGYLINPWGRKRRFPKSRDRMLVDSMKREAQNYPIQSTVADTCMLAMMRMRQYRIVHGLGFRIVNQIHDAVMVEAPENEIEATKTMFKETMGTIYIPVPNSDPLKLGIDISILDRWGQKRKKEE
jgi:DNA polymerase-1